MIHDLVPVKELIIIVVVEAGEDEGELATCGSAILPEVAVIHIVAGMGKHNFHFVDACIGQVGTQAIGIDNHGSHGVLVAGGRYTLEVTFYHPVGGILIYESGILGAPYR